MSAGSEFNSGRQSDGGLPWRDGFGSYFATSPGGAFLAKILCGEKREMARAVSETSRASEIAAATEIDWLVKVHEQSRSRP